WSRKPPVELWRRPIGPGWSSFAVAGDRLFTQEQRGDDEIVAAYNLKTGEPVWRHRDAARFWESNAGAGPRATPTLSNGRDGVAQIVLVNGPGAIGVAPSDGTVLWKHAWGGDSIVQPAVLAGGDLLIGSGSGLAANTGMLRVTVAHEPLDPARGRPGGWIVKER
ncbi:MAG: PQQ-binding-like beta-propeller repeat protein, partial [Candidatus Rokuibacteriota bacterium]